MVLEALTNMYSLYKGYSLTEVCWIQSVHYEMGALDFNTGDWHKWP